MDSDVYLQLPVTLQNVNEVNRERFALGGV